MSAGDFGPVLPLYLNHDEALVLRMSIAVFKPIVAMLESAADRDRFMGLVDELGDPQVTAMWDQNVAGFEEFGSRILGQLCSLTTALEEMCFSLERVERHARGDETRKGGRS